MSSFTTKQSSGGRSAQSVRWKRRGGARDSSYGRSESNLRHVNKCNSSGWGLRQETGHGWGNRDNSGTNRSWGSRSYSGDQGWASKAPKTTWGQIESSNGSKTKTEFSWGNSSQRSDSGNWHNQSDTQGNGWGNKPPNSSWDKQERSFSSQNKRDRFWGDGPQRSDPGKTHADSISRGNVEERAIPRQGGQTKKFFLVKSWQGTQKRDKSVIKAIESMSRPKDLTKYRGYTLLQKEGWDSTKVDDASKGPVVPQLTAVQGSGLGNTPLGFATSNIQNVQASTNNQMNQNLKLATMIRLDTNGNCNVIPVPDTLNLKVSEKKHLQYIFESEYPELFCGQKGEKCLLENVKVDFFCGYASVLLESTDFDLYIAKSEFSRKRWDLKTKQEERNGKTNSFRGGKRRGLGLQNNTNTFKQEKSTWMKTNKLNLYAKEYFNIACYGACLIILLRQVAWEKNEFNRSNVAYEFGIVDPKFMDAIKKNTKALEKDVCLQVKDMEIDANGNGMNLHNGTKGSHSFYIEAGIKYTKSGYQFDVVPFVKPV